MTDYEGSEVRVGDLMRHFEGGPDVYRLVRYRDASDGYTPRAGDAEFAIVEATRKEMVGAKAYSNVNAMVLLVPRHKRSTRRYGR